MNKYLSFAKGEEGDNNEIYNFSNGKKYYKLLSNDEGNFFAIAEFSDEQISSSIFLNILNPIYIWLVLNQISE